MRTESAFYSPETLSEYLAVPVGTIYQWRHAGKGPEAMKIGRHLRYRKSDVEAWLEEQAVAR